jgi:hypothetical protein
MQHPAIIRIYRTVDCHSFSRLLEFENKAGKTKRRLIRVRVLLCKSEVELGLNEYKKKEKLREKEKGENGKRNRWAGDRHR